MKFLKLKRKKKLGGMTLMEIIISLAVFAVLGLLMVRAAAAIEMHVRSANGLNNKIAVQGPVAEAQNENGGKVLDENVSITVKKVGSSTDILITGRLYSTADITDLQPATDGGGNQLYCADGVTPIYETIDSDEMNGNLNFKYVDGIEPATATTT